MSVLSGLILEKTEDLFFFSWGQMKLSAIYGCPYQAGVRRARFNRTQRTEEIVTKKDSRDFKIQRRGRQRERQKAIGFISKTIYCTCITLFCTFLCPLLHDYDVKMHNFAFIECVKKQRRNFTSLCDELGYMVPRNSTPGGFAYI